MMTTQEVANRMTELFKENKWEQVHRELYAADCVSIEPEHIEVLRTVKGLDAIIAKGIRFQSAIREMHGGWVSELVVGGNFITCGMGIDVTLEGMGRIQMDEVAVFEVKDGKVISEQFFY